MIASAVLLAAGRGDRLRPLTDAVAKPAVPVLDVPLGAFGLAALAAAGLRPLVNLSHLAVGAEAALRPHAPHALWFHEPREPYGTAGTLREAHAAGLLAPRVVTWNADVIADVDVAALVAAHRRAGAPGTVAVVEVETGADFVPGAGRRVEGFVDRRTDPGAAGMRFAGVAVLEREVLDLIPPEGPAGLGETVLAALAERGELAALVHRGVAFDVGTVGDYLAVSHAFLHPGAPPDPSRPGRVTTVDGGRAYLGPGARAAAGTLGPGAVVLRDGTVEGGARVERAVVWPGEIVPSGASVANVVWFHGAPLPSGGGP